MNIDEVRKEILISTLSGLFKSKGVLTAIAMIMLFIGVLLWKIYLSSDEVVNSEVLVGTVSGLHQEQTNIGSEVRMLAIKLESGNTVIIQGPSYTPVKQGIKVKVIKSKTKKGQVIYGFAGFE